MTKQAQTLTRYAIQNETKHDFSKSQHSKQNKRFLATTTALNTETSKYTYELLLTSADSLLLSKSISLHCLLLALEHTFLFITTNGQASARHCDTVLDQTVWAGNLPRSQQLCLIRLRLVIFLLFLVLRLERTGCSVTLRPRRTASWWRRISETASLRTGCISSSACISSIWPMTSCITGERQSFYLNCYTVFEYLNQLFGECYFSIVNIRW